MILAAEKSHTGKGLNKSTKTVRLPINLIKILKDTHLVYELRQIKKLAEAN